MTAVEKIIARASAVEPVRAGHAVYPVSDMVMIEEKLKAMGYAKMPQIIDGASDFFFELYGPMAGCHARTAVGMAALPLGIAVEINGEFEVS